MAGTRATCRCASPHRPRRSAPPKPRNQRIRAARESGHHTTPLHAGRVRKVGWRDLPGRLHHLTLTQRLGVALVLLPLVTVTPKLLGPAYDGLALQIGLGLCGAAALRYWFHRRSAPPIREADAFAGDLAGCNLKTTISLDIAGQQPGADRPDGAGGHGVQ